MQRHWYARNTIPDYSLHGYIYTSVPLHQTRIFIFQKIAAEFRERISEKYSRIRFVIDGDERLMMQIIDAEETYMTAWLEAQRGIMEVHLEEINNLRAASKSLLQETNDLKFIQVF